MINDEFAAGDLPVPHPDPTACERETGALRLFEELLLDSQTLREVSRDDEAELPSVTKSPLDRAHTARKRLRSCTMRRNVMPKASSRHHGLQAAAVIVMDKVQESATGRLGIVESKRVPGGVRSLQPALRIDDTDRLQRTLKETRQLIEFRVLGGEPRIGLQHPSHCRTRRAKRGDQDRCLRDSGRGRQLLENDQVDRQDQRGERDRPVQKLAGSSRVGRRLPPRVRGLLLRLCEAIGGH